MFLNATSSPSLIQHSLPVLAAANNILAWTVFVQPLLVIWGHEKYTKYLKPRLLEDRPGTESHFPSEKLFYWLTRPRNPVLTSDDPLANMFIEAMLKNEPVEFIYVAGSKPGLPRKVNVSLVFQHAPEGRIYVAGYCPERSANRVFALDLVMVIQAWNRGANPQ